MQISPRVRTKRQALRRSDRLGSTAARIVSTATQLFASNGFDGTTTKEICAAARVNIAAIHYHFGTKENLYRNIIEGFGGARLESVQRILGKPENEDELRVRLEMFLEEWVDACLRQPELYRIVQTEVELLHARSEKVFRNTLLKVCETLVDFLAHAKKRGLIRKDIDPRIGARCLFSQLSHQARSDRVNKKYFGVSLTEKTYRQQWLKQTLQTFLHGISRS